jgi:hypothetical protein
MNAGIVHAFLLKINIGITILVVSHACEGESSHVFMLPFPASVIPVTGSGGPQGSETSRLPLFLDNRLTDGGEVN